MSSQQPMLSAQYAQPGYVPVSDPKAYGQVPYEGGVQQAQRPAAEPAKYRDAWAAILFLVHCVVVGYFAFTKGIDAINDDAADTADDPDADSDSSGLKSVLYVAAAAAVGGGVLSGMWITFMMQNAEGIIQCMLWTNIIFFLVGAAIFALAVPGTGGAIPAVFMVILALISWCYMRAVQRRIPFAAAHLKLACTAVKEFFSVVWVAYGMLVAQIAWVFLSVLCMIGVYQYYKDDAADTDDAQPATNDDPNAGDESGNMSGMAYFGLLISFYWGQQVVRNVLHCTVAGTVASWWFKPQEGGVVSGSIKRACTTSFGSICLGSLIVAVLRAMEQMAREAERRGDAFACLARCILQCVRQLIEYFNRWAFVYVGIYGYDFKRSGKAVMDLFKQRGWTAIINDDLVENCLALGAVMVGVVVSGCCVALAQAESSWFSDLGGSSDASVILGVVGFFVGYAMCSVMMGVIDSGVATVFVCFAEDPASLQVSHPNEHNEIMQAWARFHPHIQF